MTLWIASQMLAITNGSRNQLRWASKGPPQLCRHHGTITVNLSKELDASPDGAVCIVVTSGQDSLDRIWMFCGRRPCRARSWQAGDLQLYWIHPHPWALKARQIPNSPENTPKPDAYQVAGNQSGVATTDVPDHSRSGEMATSSCNSVGNLTWRWCVRFGI
jgi:hypothetical protein